MRYAKYHKTLNLWVDESTKSTIEEIAANERRSMAEVARDLLAEGMKARGIA